MQLHRESARKFPNKIQMGNTGGTQVEKQQRDKELKEATRLLIKGCKGLVRSSGACRVRKSTLSRYQSHEEKQMFMPIDIVADLEHKANQPIIARALAKLAGWELVKLPPSDATGRISAQLKKVFKESGELLIAGASALEDNRVDPDEAREVLVETNEAIAALVQLRALLQERVRSGAGEAAA